MIKDKKDKSSSGGGGTSSGNNNSGSGSSKNNNSSSSSSSSASNPSSSSKSSSPSTSSSKTTNANSNNKSGSNNNSKNNILGIEEEIIEQGNSEQLIVTSIKHEDGSPPTNIIKKESTSQSTSSAAGSSSNPNSSNNNNNSNSNDSNNNNDTNDNKNSSSTNASLQDDKDSIGANDNSITDELLNNEDLGLPGSNSGNKLMGGMHIKTEDGCSDMGADNFVPMNQGGGGPGPGGGSCRMMSQTSPERIQPLPSNVVNKQSNNMEYMQQQSQIFVFSTQLANKGAECVISGQFPSIIAYHCAQPGTKKILEKYPLKINQFNRQNPPPGWMANVNQMKNKNSRIPNPNNFMMKNNPMGMPQMPPQQQQSNQGPGGMHPGSGGPFSQSCDMGNVGDNMMPWGPPGGPQMGLGDPLGNTGPNSNPNDPTIPNPMGFNPDGLVPEVSGSNNSGSNLPHQSPSSMSGGNLCNMDPTSPNIATLQGVKIPDENLTSEQMQHRKEKLEILNHLKSNLFKEGEGLVPGARLPEGELSPVMGPMQGGPSSMPNAGSGGPSPIMSGGPVGPMSGNPSQMPPKMGPMGPKMGPGMGPGPMNQCQSPFPMGPRGMGMSMGGPRGGNMCRPPGPMGMGPNSMNDPMGGGPMGGPMGDMPCRPMNPMNPNMPMGPGNPNQMMGMPHMPGNMNPMGMNQMGPGSGPNCNMPNQMGGMMGQKGMGPGGPNMMGPGPNSMQAQMEWNKLQHQYYEENKRKGMPGGMPSGMPGNMDMNLDHPGMQGMPNRPGMPPNMRNNPNVRGQQGPPPPYHQTPRSASVPIATQSPNPNSPNNPTSNLSLPSPRGGCNSTLNSPAAGDTNRPLNPQQAFKHMNPRQSPTASQDSPVGINRQMTSNPSTPISSHLSPSASLKDLEMGPNPKPNLMPVPSPQQISYLNTFEGQELTIQKQPNTNLKDGSSSIGAPNQSNISLDNRLPGQKTPTSQSDSRFSSSTPGSVSNHFPIPSSPHTPGGTPNPGDKNRINSAGPSPQGLQRSSSMMGNDSQSFPLSQPNPNDGNMPPFSTDSPNMPFGPNSQQNMQQSQQQNSQQQQQQQQQQSQQNPAGNPGNQKMGDFMGNPGKGPGEMGGGSPFPSCGRPENLPLNPNTSGIPNTKPSLVHDPISSLAQMSQQLTSNSMNGQQGGPPAGMMGGFVNNGMMSDMGQMGQMGQGGNMNMPVDGMGMGGGPGSMEYGMGMGMGPGQFGPMGGPGGPRPMSPKIGGFPGPGGMPPRMMSRGPPMGPNSGPYNGTNIQVKPGAPNTIQYLPARPQVSNTNPRGPPSLDFLRFAGPMNMDDMNKSNNQNMPFFPNQNAGGGCGGGMDGDSPMGPMGGPMSGMGPNTPPGMMNQNPMMMRGMRGGNMMRFPGPPGNPCMMGNNNFNSSNNLGGNNTNMGGNDQMFPNNPNAQMFVPGPKGSPMGGPPLGQNGPNQVPNNSMNGPPPPEMQQQMQQQMMAQGGPPGGPHFNKSHYVGPNTADPNYAQQYHNFQQQLYATNTRNQQGPMGGMGGPNNQQFLMPK